MDWGKDKKMKSYVFSIGEKTTELCCELMESYGFEVVLFQSRSSLASKLKDFYQHALETEDGQWLRIDADIIPNQNVKKLAKIGGLFGDNPSWVCASGFDWYKQDRGAISIHVMNRESVKRALRYIPIARTKDRPETHIWRQPDINPFTLIVESFNSGLHGYGQLDQRERIKNLKHIRSQVYDWELVDKVEAL